MKAKVVDSENKEKGTIDLPFQFSEPVRADLIHRAVITIQANKRQPYGAFPEAGKQYSIDISKRRRDYKTVYGSGGSRTPRKILSRSGTRMNWVGAFAPQTVGGRQAHPPKAEKIWARKINDKERRKALRSAIAATVHKDVVADRGHRIPAHYPLVVDSGMETLSKTKDVENMLLSLGFEQELLRTSVRRIRGGKGKVRGRRFVGKIGPLIVISKADKIVGAAKNIPGVDVVEVRNLNAELLAPGARPGRMTIWSSAAIEAMAKERLFA